MAIQYKSKDDKKKPTTRVTKTPWKKESSTLERRDVNIRKTTPGSKGEMFDKAFGKARKSGKNKFEWEGKSYSTNLAKPEYRTTKPNTPPKEVMKPMTTKQSPIPPSTVKRQLTPGYKKPATAIYTKKERKPDTDTKALGKGGVAKIKYATAKLNPLRSASASGKGDSKRYTTGKKTFQTTTRPVSEKDAYKPGLTRRGKQKLAKGVKVAQLGSEGTKGGKTTKRTQSGIATEKNMATKSELKSGKAKLAKKKEKYGY